MGYRGYRAAMPLHGNNFCGVSVSPCVPRQGCHSSTNEPPHSQGSLGFLEASRTHTTSKIALPATAGSVTLGALSKNTDIPTLNQTSKQLPVGISPPHILTLPFCPKAPPESEHIPTRTGFSRTRAAGPFAGQASCCCPPASSRGCWGKTFH